VIGIALGDGNLSNPNDRAVRLRVSCDVKYPRLIKKIAKSIKLLFPDNKVNLIYRKNNCVDISCYSNKWEELLGWRSKGGSKFLQDADIPDWIFTKKAYLINCVRGLIETDGSIYWDRGYKMVIFTSIIECLAKSVERAIRQLGFIPRLYRIEKQNSKYGYRKSILFHVRISQGTQKFLDLVKPEKK
jgi:hypothetical protein